MGDLVRVVRSSVRKYPPIATGCGLGFQSSNQSSPELGTAIHSLTDTEVALPSEAAMFTLFAVGRVNTQFPVPSGTRPIEESVACNPNATELSKPPPLAGLSKRKRVSPLCLMLNP